MSEPQPPLTAARAGRVLGAFLALFLAAAAVVPFLKLTTGQWSP